MVTESRHGFLKKAVAPLFVMKEERSYAVWLVFVAFFGLINIWGGLCLGYFDSVSSAFKEGIVYTYSISVCAPFLAEVFVKQIVKKRTGSPVEFVSYQMLSSAINIVWILILTFLWLGSFKGSIPVQILIGILSTAFAFYMYCVSQMEQHKKSLSGYNDSPYSYLKDEKMRMNDTAEGSRTLTTIPSEKGDIEI